MSTAVVDHYRAALSSVADSLPGASLEWLRQTREEALRRFSELGFPDTGNEDWKYTSVRPIEKHAFAPVETSCMGLIPEDIDGLVCRDMHCHLLVFVNGRFAPELSERKIPGEHLHVTSLASVLRDDPDALESHLARHANAGADGFAALNTAFIGDGACIVLPENAVINDPVHILHVTTKQDREVLSQPRNLIVLGENSSVTVVESYAGMSSGAVYFTNALTEVVLGRNAGIEHYKLQEESTAAYHVATMQVHQERGSRFVSHSVSVGARIARNDINVRLVDEGAECTLNGLYLGSGRQHVDYHTRVDHVSPHCTSREFYKGILNGRARAVFNGRVFVHPGAQKTLAEQSNSNLLLSRDAEVDTKPQLEIYADDVQCAHGATVGQLDEDMLFYLRARGISEPVARGLLTWGFAHDIVDRMDILPIQQRLEQILVEQLPDAEHIREVV